MGGGYLDLNCISLLPKSCIIIVINNNVVREGYKFSEDELEKVTRLRLISEKWWKGHQNNLAKGQAAGSWPRTLDRAVN